MKLMKNDYVEILLQYFSLRQNANPSYSQNAFSRDLGLRPSHLSEILQRKKGMSEKSAIEVSKKLKMDKKERFHFVQLVLAAHSRSPMERRKAKSNLKSIPKDKTYLSRAEFNIIYDWINAALLEYLRVKNRQFSVSSAANYFEVRPERIRSSLNNLLEVGLIKRHKDLYLVESNVVFSPQNVPSPAKKSHHLRLLKVAMKSYLEQDFSQRDFMSQVIAIKSSNIDEAKLLIREFHKKMNLLLSPDQGEKDAVYTFSTQLFSLYKGGKNEV